MKVITEPFHYLLIENFYTEEELKMIWLELDMYSCFPDRYLPPTETGSATNNFGDPLKLNGGLWLDEIYSGQYRYMSNILELNQKLFPLIKPESSWFFKDIQVNSDNTLISYYENNDFYKKHNDISYVTACTWFYKEPKRFSGGDFHFDDYDITIECKHNTCVVFPSNIYHSVDQITIPKQYEKQGLGRYCMSQFIKVT